MFDDMISFLAFRDSLVQEKVEEIMEAVNRGETSITFDIGDLTQGELEEVKREVNRRLGDGCSFY